MPSQLNRSWIMACVRSPQFTISFNGRMKGGCN
uniref:Uncharacterized protein n=1 Tax=Utricularia reniformis TaxID=192314 RepID=A0A1Y0B011_9LAMI|nr:hypothetical protein AEK19_MT0476 [Utricularia reniformis]ART30733.1 hypothetical protein AEK19_MT0476 [Utricularia reniformis]